MGIKKEKELEEVERIYLSLSEWEWWCGIKIDFGADGSHQTVLYHPIRSMLLIAIYQVDTIPDVLRLKMFFFSYHKL